MNPQPPYHDDTLARLSDYLDGALSPEERGDLEQRLAADPALAAELAAMHQVDKLVQNAAAPLPDVDWDRFTLEARDRRNRTHPQRQTLLRILRPMAAAAAIALIVTGAVWWQSNGRTEIPKSVIEVNIQRMTMSASVTTASVSRTLPPDALATTGPAPRGRTLVVTVAADVEQAVSVYELEDDAALF